MRLRHAAPQPPTRRLAAAALAAGLLLAGCSGSSSSSSSPSGGVTGDSSPSATSASTGADSQVLPVTANPINNPSTVKALEIESVLVENNVNPTTGKDAGDHLEIALANTGSSRLANVEVFYTFTDPTTRTTESYYAQLPGSFNVPAGGTRIVHFDDTGTPDHFPENKFSLYRTSANALDVSVTVSADGAAVQTTTIQKDAGGVENPDE